jgi:thiamine pyrophosphokinase
MKQYTLVIAHGAVPSMKIIGPLVAGAKCIVCADGGANTAARLGIRPDAIVGDCDSLSPATRRKFRNAEILYRPSQYSTDLEKAFDYCLEKHIRSIVVLGATGKRLDHTLSNMSIIRKYHDRLSIRCIDQYGESFLVTKKNTFTAVVGQIVSLVPLGKCRGVTTDGLRYPLTHETLEVGIREGQSNVATKRRVNISVNHGTLLVYKKNI